MGRRRYELSDEEWEMLQSHLPKGKSGEGKRGRPRAEDRQIFNGIVWLLRSGAPWRDIPDRYGPFTTIYTRFRELIDLAVFEKIVSALQLEEAFAELIELEEWEKDSTIIRAQISAAGAPEKKSNPPKNESPDHALGRSRGGWGTKIHGLTDGAGNGLTIALSPGQKANISQAQALIESTRIAQKRGRPRTRPKVLNADKSYDSQKFRKYLGKRQIKANSPEQALAKGRIRRRKGRKPKLDKQRYKNRNQVERFFGKLKQFRRIATRYDKYAQVFKAFIFLGIIVLYLRKYFSNTT